MAGSSKRHLHLAQIAFFVVATLGALIFMLNSTKDFEPSEFGLGLNTSSTYERFEDGTQMSSIGRGCINLRDTLKKSTLLPQGKRTLWLGASQLHAINSMVDGDHLAVHYANQHLPDSHRVFQASAPNGNFHELWAMWQCLNRLPPGEAENRERKHGDATLNFEHLVIALTYDDLREVGVRPALQKHYALAPLHQPWVHKAKGRALTDSLKNRQERFEDSLISNIERLAPLYKKRAKFSAFWESQLKLWVTKFGYALASKPQVRVPIKIQKINEKALWALVDDARRRGIHVHIYQAPHQPGLKPFYHPLAEYEGYFQALQNQVQKHADISFHNLKDIVPQHLWGLSASGQPDCFHFKDEGHQILGKAIADILSNSQAPAQAQAQAEAIEKDESSAL